MFRWTCGGFHQLSLHFAPSLPQFDLTTLPYVVIYGTAIDHYIGGKLLDYGIKLSYTTAIILQALSNGYQYGFDIIDVTGLPSGTVYPALRRFEEAGVVTSRWEAEEVAEREQRSPRRYYELTKLGHEALDEARQRYRALEKLFAGAQKPKPSDA